MTSLTVEMLHPYQSTIDLDGLRTDREVVQDIAFDGETMEGRCSRTRKARSYAGAMRGRSIRANGTRGRQNG